MKIKTRYLALFTVLAFLIVTGTLPAAITKVLNAVAVNGTTNSTSITITNAVYPPAQNIIIDTSGNQTNYIQASLDNTNFTTLATNIVSTGTSTTNFQPSLPAATLYYRVLIVTTNNTTNTIYFSN